MDGDRPWSGWERRLARAGDRRLRYRDGEGKEREHKTQVTQDFWADHAVGSPIALVYSRFKPSISGVKYQVELKRKALAKRGR